ncbi:hypothetical protein ACC745_39230, partial [Rhizobium ruizarguesonis]
GILSFGLGIFSLRAAIDHKKLTAMSLHKDEVLNSLAATANVAQFFSFRPSTTGVISQSYRRSNIGKSVIFRVSRDAAVA